MAIGDPTTSIPYIEVHHTPHAYIVPYTDRRQSSHRHFDHLASGGRKQNKKIDEGKGPDQQNYQHRCSKTLLPLKN
jgi:hypothetical protein